MMFKYKNVVLSQGNRAMSLYISIDIWSVQAVVSCLFRLILLVAVDMAAKDRIEYNRPTKRSGTRATNFIKVCNKKKLESRSEVTRGHTLWHQSISRT